MQQQGAMEQAMPAIADFVRFSAPAFLFLISSASASFPEGFAVALWTPSQHTPMWLDL